MESIEPSQSYSNEPTIDSKKTDDSKGDLIGGTQEERGVIKEEYDTDKGNVISPPTPPIQITTMIKEEPKDDEMSETIEDKLITCGSTATVCRFPVLKGFYFCHKHILEDKASPYRRCSFVSPDDNKGCFSPAPKNGKKKCHFHN